MAKDGAENCGLLLAFVLLLTFMFTFFDSCTCTKSDEFELLLSIKRSMHDPLNSLSNWDLSFPFCQWKGITCDRSSHVATINLSGKNLTGNIPDSIFHFPQVQTLDLSNNQLLGVIPLHVSSSSLLYLNLSNNNFTGSLPRGSCPRLQVLDLSNNVLSGKIPEEIGLFSGLEFLDLGGNVLVGRIPKSISNLTRLQVLTLDSNQLIGEIPRELGLMRRLKWVYLGYNNLSGSIPTEMGELTSLNHLDLVNNNLTGEIPSSLGNLTNLRYLFLYLNKLTGPIPRSIFGLVKLISLDLSDNNLSGEIPELIIQLQDLEVLQLFSNNFTGEIPNALTNLPHLQVLQLWSNKLSGKIPRDLGMRNNLTVLDLSTNSLTGKIPEGLCQSGHLFKLILFSNSLEGEIPKSLSQCKTLKRVRLQNNLLSGGLPPEFTDLPLVYFLDLSSNNLSGIILRRWNMSELQMFNVARNNFSGNLPENFGGTAIENMDLSENRFSGTIPAGFGTLLELTQLNLSGNELSGNIPTELSSCKKLVTLDLSHNLLGGHILDTLAEMPVLGRLDLSENQLTGEVPASLGKVDSLVQVNISYNRLRGHLPATGAFLAINSSAVAGNHLCGGAATAGLPACRAVKTPVWWVILTCFLIVFVGLAFVAFIIVFRRQKKDNFEIKRVENEEGTWELQFFDTKFSKQVSADDLLSSARGKNVTSDNTRFEVSEAESDSANFPVEWAELGKLCHPNVIRVIGMISRLKRAGGFVVYEHVEGKGLGEVLRALSWDRRRRIALGIAKALRYLHGRQSPGILVRDLSPEKIVVDIHGEPRLRLGTPGMLRVDAKGFASSAYVAPETKAKETKDYTEKSDIYGFGLILIELLTGKSPGDVEIGSHETIVAWGRYCYSDCHIDTWADPMIKAHVLENQSEIVETMNLALHCTAGDPTARPSASEVVKTLESIIRPSSCVFGFKSSSTI